MIFKNFFILLCLSLLHNLTAEKTETNRRVMAWVAPYAIDISNQRLNESYEGFGMKDSLTHLGLQFWNPTKDGKLQLVTKFNKINDELIAEYKKWAKTNNVKLMLCIYNGATEKGWDWDLARSAFDTNCNILIDSLVNETLRLKFDGIDIDFEGKGDLNKDKEAYLKFIKALSKRLKEKGKELTIDSFAYKWHAPNQTWWSELLPHIDGLHVMGYSETGASAKDWRSYQFLKEAVGKFPEKLLIGVPSHKSEWQGSSALENLNWLKNNPAVGVAIWDTQLQDQAWKTKEMWQTIHSLKNK